MFLSCFVRNSFIPQEKPVNPPQPVSLLTYMITPKPADFTQPCSAHYQVMKAEETPFSPFHVCTRCTLRKCSFDVYICE